MKAKATKAKIGTVNTKAKETPNKKAVVGPTPKAKKGGSMKKGC